MWCRPDPDEANATAARCAPSRVPSRILTRGAGGHRPQAARQEPGALERECPVHRVGPRRPQGVDAVREGVETARDGEVGRHPVGEGGVVDDRHGQDRPVGSRGLGAALREAPDVGRLRPGIRRRHREDGDAVGEGHGLGQADRRPAAEREQQVGPGGAGGLPGPLGLLDRHVPAHLGPPEGDGDAVEEVGPVTLLTARRHHHDAPRTEATDLLLEVLGHEPAPEPDPLRQRHVRERRAPSCSCRGAAPCSRARGVGPSVADRSARVEDRRRRPRPRWRSREVGGNGGARPRPTATLEGGGTSWRARRVSEEVPSARTPIDDDCPRRRRPRPGCSPPALADPVGHGRPVDGRPRHPGRRRTGGQPGRRCRPVRHVGGREPRGLSRRDPPRRRLPRLGHLPLGVAERDPRGRPRGRRGPAHPGGRHPLGRRRRARPARPGVDRRRRVDGIALGHRSGAGTHPRARRAPRRGRLALPDRARRSCVTPSRRAARRRRGSPPAGSGPTPSSRVPPRPRTALPS